MRLNRHKFAKWLAAKPPAEVVGENRDCHSCPIANFYHEASGGSEIVIFQDANWGGYRIDRGYNSRRLPDWATAFVFQIDGNANGKITAGRALEVLSGVAP